MKKSAIILVYLLIAALPGIFAQDAPVSTAGNVITTGSSVILPITVTNFTNIGSCDIKLFYDPAIATVTSVTASPAISGANTGINFNNTVPGAVNFGWFATPGRSVPDNTVIFNIHFSKVSNGITQVTWSTVDAECEYYDGSYNALNDSPAEVFYIPGSVIFQEYAPTTTIMPAIACAGTNISVPVKVSDFNAIGAVSLTINYDAAVLDFLPGDNTSGYPGLSINNTIAGTIIIGGFSSSNTGETYPDNTTLFTLNFYYKGGASPLTFNDDDGTSCEYTGPLGSPTLTDWPKSTYYIDGEVSGYPAPTLVSATAIDALCFGGNGTINIEYTGGTGTLNYTIGAETNTTGSFTRPAGTYTYSVSDASGCPPVTGSVTITQPTDIAASASVTTPIACFGGTATVTLSASGGTGAYSYTFNGVTQNNGEFTNIPAGSDYAWSVKDANNCEKSGTLDVTQPNELLADVTSQSNVLCYGEATGSVVITPSGGVGPYEITPAQTGLEAGDYTFTVTDANSCTTAVDVTITQPAAALTATLTSQNNVLCYGRSYRFSSDYTLGRVKSPRPKDWAGD
ncbi:MAG: cohesin domain-containing protein [Lentimicrobium sp.]|uniref:cohesin domain-containing protein n=1 Tax=Lentimicrobium sp. TaxID=2034841 RepID=UPI0025D7C86D|nr:cohesin domain-containing protein [Lentimicrobium sp.]MCO5257750.1 cohesin domain-containing protein [Lentimicrobium sp.]